jgi:hypothetical protein
MGARYTDTCIYAFDEQGCLYRVSHEYLFSWGCGGHRVIYIGDAEYYSEILYDDDGPIELGEYLPVLALSDLQSYYSEKPTNEIVDALRKAGVLGIDMVKLLMVKVYSVNAGPYRVICSTVTADTTNETDCELCNCEDDPIYISDSIAIGEWDDVLYIK